MMACGFVVAVPTNYALQFDGIDDYVMIPDSASLDLSTGMTLEAWVYVNNTAGGRFVISKWNDPAREWSYGLKVHNHRSNFQVTLSQGTHSDLADLTGTTSIQTGQWIHVATTYDGENVSLYYNGVLEATSTAAPGSICDSAADLLIGNVFGYSGLETSDGLIDEVRIWDYARTADEVVATMHHALFGTEEGLVGYWDFNEGSGQIAHDRSGHGNHGVLGSGSGVDAHDPRWVISTAPVAPVPEPSTLALLGVGALGLAAFRRRKGSDLPRPPRTAAQ